MKGKLVKSGTKISFAAGEVDRLKANKISQRKEKITNTLKC